MAAGKSSFSGADRARAREVLRRYEGQLLNKPNVVGAGIGEDEGGQLVLVVMVREKMPAEQLPKEALLPTELEGWAIDVREIGELRAQSGSKVERE